MIVKTDCETDGSSAALLILQLTAGRAECGVTGAGCCRDWEPFCYVKLGFVIPVRAETRFPFNTYEGLHVTN